MPDGELAAERVATFDQRLHVAHVTAPAGTTLVARVPDLALMGLAITTVGACRLERPRSIAVPPDPGHIGPTRQQCQQAPLKAVGVHAEARMLAMAREIIRRRPAAARERDGRFPAAAYPIGLPAGWGIGVAHEVAGERSYGGAAKRDQMEPAANPEREGV